MDDGDMPYFSGFLKEEGDKLRREMQSQDEGTEKLKSAGL
jgi:hypothetical protein